MNADAHNIEGSIFKWVNEGRPIVDNEGEKAGKVHCYNAMFGLLLEDEKKKYFGEE